MKIVEVNVNNENEYLNQIVKLEKIVLQNMEDNGKKGQLFITGAEDISKYIQSKENTVLVSIDDKNMVDAAVYITQGQSFFTYNDITKYFKASNEYEEFVRAKYNSDIEYKKAALEAYKLKIEAYNYARRKILQEYPQYHNISEFLKSELNSENSFDEKSLLRENLNLYMFEFIKNMQNKGVNDAVRKYEEFYWMTFSKIRSLIYGKGSDKVLENPIVKELEKNLALEEEHEQICKKAHLIIYDEEQDFDLKKYFSANPNNSIEIDTYITDPTKRSYGKARILVYEGIKKHINRFFTEEENKEIFLCSTLHRDNVSSKYVSEFFNLKDSLFVNRRSGRDREVHITRVKKEEAQEYLKCMAEKLAVLYNYNPDNIDIGDKKRAKILSEQMKYEKDEFSRLSKVRNESNDDDRYKMYDGFMEKKIQKIEKIQRNLDEISLE